MGHDVFAPAVADHGFPDRCPTLQLRKGRYFCIKVTFHNTVLSDRAGPWLRTAACR